MKRQFLQPKDMWARVENGNLLYVPVVTVHGTDHAHVYLGGQMAREVAGPIVGIGDMRAQIRKTCETRPSRRSSRSCSARRGRSCT